MRPKYRKSSSHRTGDRTKASRMDRMAEEQQVDNIILATEPESEYRRFQDTITTLYGPTGIGKTTFSHEIEGVYQIATEPRNNFLEFRSTRVKNWPTFKAFVSKVEQEPEFVKTVSMWCIDTIDALIPKAISTVCFEWGLTDLSEEGFARAWMELKDDLVFTLLRLADLGPGILMVSHERQRETKGRRLALTKESMDLSDSICNAVSYLSSIIIHMRYVNKAKQSAELGHLRCLSITGSEEEDAKDNTKRIRLKYPEGIIKFKTEREAVRKVMECFESGVVRHKKSKKKVRHK